MGLRATPSRGVLLNNPGCIRRDGTRWQGLAANQPDPEFFSFESPRWGIRAIARILITYQDARQAEDGSRIDTVKEFIERWAPPIDNPTGDYVRFVRLAMKPDLSGNASKTVIDVHQYDVLFDLVCAIIRFENGYNPYTTDEIDAGLRLAGVEPPLKPLGRSRTIQAAGTAGLAAIAQMIANVAETLDPGLAGGASFIRYFTLGAIYLSLGVVVWARIDDLLHGKRP